MLVGATTAATATALVRPTDATAAGEDARAASYTSADRPPTSLGEPGRASASGTVTRTTPSTTAHTTATTPATTTTTPKPPASTQPAPVTPPPAADVPNQVVTLVNQARAASGCAALTVDARLTAAAVEHSTDMANRGYFDHDTPEGEKFDDRIKAAGYPTPGAENIAMGQQTPDAVMTAWMNSPGHKDNIVNCKLTTIGVGFDPDGFYWTQDFGF
jgi:uncharacterized protein YkwD